MMNSKIAYETLQLTFNAPLNDIKKAYRKLALKCHPDRKQKSNLDFIQIKKAYDFLLKLKEDSKESEIKTLQQPPPNEFPLRLTLEEIFKGAIKQPNVTIKVVDEYGNERQESKTVKVTVHRGCLPGSRITVPKEGDKFYGRPAANLVFIVAEEAHSIFKRSRFDLQYIAKISGKESLYGCVVSVPTLENETIQFSVQEAIKHSTVKRISNRGLYYPDPANKRGDLLVSFSIVFETPKSQDPPIEYDLFVTLEQIFTGCQKRIKIQRNVIDSNKNVKVEDKIVTVNIAPGAIAETKYTFHCLGDQNMDTIPADIIFVLREKPHNCFHREGADLHCIINITASQAKEGGQVMVPTIENKLEQIQLNSIQTDKTVILQNQGLPMVQTPSKRGNLIINFKINDGKDGESEPMWTNPKNKLGKIFNKIEYFESSIRANSATKETDKRKLLNNLWPKIIKTTKEQVAVKDTTYDLLLSPAELTTGVVKKIDIFRKEVDINGTEKLIYNTEYIAIEANTYPGQQYKLYGKGDKYYGTAAADLTFIIRVRPGNLWYK